jgi:uncharacterized protein
MACLRRIRIERLLRKRWIALIATLVVGASALIWAFIVEPQRLVVRDVTLTLPGLADAHDGIRLAILTDLHVGSPFHGVPKLRRIVEAANELRPDLVLILGDLVIQGVLGGKFVPPEEIAAELEKLRSTHGLYAVLGNHDWWFDGARVQAALQEAGVVLLEDTATAIAANSRPLWLAGVSDFWERPHDVHRALATVPESDPVIVMTHNPDVFPDVPSRVTLTVAGHTHGGQVDLPLIGRPIVPSRFGQRFAAGNVVENDRHLFVGTGSGTSILPVRFRVPPEVLLLVLRRPASLAER